MLRNRYGGWGPTPPSSRQRVQGAGCVSHVSSPIPPRLASSQKKRFTDAARMLRPESYKVGKGGAGEGKRPKEGKRKDEREVNEYNMTVWYCGSQHNLIRGPKRGEGGRNAITSSWLRHYGCTPFPCFPSFKPPYGFDNIRVVQRLTYMPCTKTPRYAAKDGSFTP